MKPIDYFSNPEYALVILTPQELRFYIGDNVQLELIESRDVLGDDTPRRFFTGKQAVIAHRPLMGLKRFALHLLQTPRLARLPVVIAGDEIFLNAFTRFFNHPFGVVTHTLNDMTALTCPEILAMADSFKPKVRDIYATHFKERLKTQMRTGRIISDVGELAKEAFDGNVSRLLITSKPLLHTVESDLAETVIREGGKVQIIPEELLPPGIKMLGVLRGEVHAHSPLFAMDA